MNNVEEEGKKYSVISTENLKPFIDEGRCKFHKMSSKEFLLNKTFQLGEGDLTLSGRVGFDGQTTGQIDYDKEIGPGKLNVFYNPNDYGVNYNFLNRKF